MIIFTIFWQFVFVLKSEGITNNTDLKYMKICWIKFQYLNPMGCLCAGGGGGVVVRDGGIFEQHRLGLLLEGGVKF